MTDKQLANKAVDIKGKQYVQVVDRILYLDQNENGNYSVKTSYEFYPDLSMWVVSATLTIGEREFMGTAQEIINEGYINKTSALENCETSAVGRACAMAGIGVIDSIASVDEINKAGAREQYNEEPEKEWFNAYNSKKGEWIDDGVYDGLLDMKEKGKTPDEILKAVQKKYKVSKAAQEAIKELLSGEKEEVDDYGNENFIDTLKND